MVRPTLKKQIPNLQQAIKDAAWKHIAKEGAPALSLRAIARDSRSPRLPSITIFLIGMRW